MEKNDVVYTTFMGISMASRLECIKLVSDSDEISSACRAFNFEHFDGDILKNRFSAQFWPIVFDSFVR